MNSLLINMGSTSTDNYELTENIDVKNEDVMLQNLFNKVHLPPIHRYIVVHHIQVSVLFLMYEMFRRK